MDSLLPSITLFTLVSTFLTGPTLYPTSWSFFLIIFLTIQNLLTFSHTIKWFLVTKRVKKAIDSSKALGETKTFPIHVIIIPNYKEPLKLLQTTLENLAHHPNSSRYHVVLAMEQGEPSSSRESKLSQLSNYPFKLSYTLHPSNLPGEARGKASNTNWAAQCISKLYPDSGSVYLTIQDADSQIPALYFTHLDHYISGINPLTRQPHNHTTSKCIFIPPPFYGINQHQVPSILRIQDACQSLLQCQNLANPWPLAIFATSHYTIPLSLAKKVNFWDTSYRGLGEDMHMTLKSLYHGAKTLPVYVPVAGCNVSSSGPTPLSNFLSNIQARFTQALRHYYADTDVSYSLSHSSDPRFFLYFLQVCELYVLTATTGWISAFACPLLSFFNPDNPIIQQNISIVQSRLLPFFAILQLINLIIYEFHHRKVSKFLNLQPRTLVNLLDYLWLPVIGLLFVTIPATISSLINGWTGYKEREYVVAEKRLE